MSRNIETVRKAGQELRSVSAALDWLFNRPKLPIKGTKIVFSARHHDFTLMVIQNQAGPEVIIGNLEYL